MARSRAGRQCKDRTVWPFGRSAAEFTFKLPTPCFDNEFSGCYSKFCPNGGSIMAWFDRNPGGKKGPEAEPKKIAEAPKPVTEPAPLAAAPEPKPVVAAKEVPPPQPAEPGLVAYLYKGSRVSGQLSFQGPARIDGAVDGEIQCQGTLTIGEGAEMRAKISGQVVIIRGRVEGNVTAKEKVELIGSGKVNRQHRHSPFDRHRGRGV